MDHLADTNILVRAIEKHHVRAQSVSRLQVHDARLAAAMKVYGVVSILTFNVDDFRRFPGIDVLHPETVVQGHGRR